MAEIVLVHGLWFGPWSLAFLARQWAAMGFSVRRFSYNTTRQPLASHAQALADFCARSRAPDQYLAGHSMGGLLILHALHLYPQLPLHRVLLLGTPLSGSCVAGRCRHWPGTRQLLGQAADALTAPAPEFPAACEVGQIAGTRPLGLGRLTGALAGTSDGTVALAETRHPGLADHLELPVTHTSMLYSSVVARQGAKFLCDGRFASPGNAA